MVDQSQAQTLSQELGISAVLSRLLVSRGYASPASAENFLNPSLDDLHPPHLLPDYAAARDEILGAKERGDLIFVHGDYDVDGMTSAALLTRFLRRIGCNVHPHVPHRVREGYGIHESAVDQAHQLGAKLFLTCDCGSGAIAQIERAREFGMRVVVTDHHELHDERPNAHAFVNPHRTDASYPFAGLCGVGVAFKLCAGLAQETGVSLSNFLRAYLDLATLGTVADVMPLVDENRVIVAHGCRRIQESKKPGIQALLANIGLKGDVTSRTIGFQLGPRLNAAGRLEDAALSLRLLLSEDRAEADTLAAELEKINTERREQQDRIVEIAKERVLAEGLDDQFAIVVGDLEWHSGIIGLVAGRLVEAFYRPAFVMAVSEDGSVKGSARTIPGYHLADALKRATEHLKSHGGHELAAGFSASRDRVQAFKEAIQADARAHLTPDLLIRKLAVDAVVSVGDLNLATLAEMERLAPFGQANPEPLLASMDLRVERKDTFPNKPDSLKLTLRDANGASVVAKGWGWTERLHDVNVGDTVSVAFSASINRFNGRESVEWTLKDLAK